MENTTQINFPFVNNKGVMLELLNDLPDSCTFRYASFNYRGDILKSKTTISIPKKEVFNRDKIFLSENGKYKGRHYYDDNRGMFTRIYLDPIFEPFIK